MISGRIQSCTSSSASSSSTIPHPPCLTSAARHYKFPLRLSPRALSISQRVSRNCVVPRYSSGWAEAQLSFSKSDSKHLLPVAVGALVTSNTQAIPTGPLVAEEKIGVLLLNLGGPETLEDVQPFLFNLFADPDIIRLPRLFRFLQKPLAQFISVLRAPKSKEGYASIGGGSPLRRITDAQAEELRKSLWVKNVPAKVYVGMRYWHPFTEEAIEQIKKDGITKLVVLPLYPQFSISTSGSSLRLLESIFRDDEYLVNMRHTVIPSWYQREGYIKSMANLIEKELQKFDLPEKVSFVSEHIETLEEIDVEYKELAFESGIENWGRVPALGCEPMFISDLADAVIESLPYVGAMAVSNLEARQSLVPLGSVEELLAAYDSQRRELPPPVTVWEWGWTKSAETWNGRAAMLAVLVLLLLEVTTGEGFLHQWGVLPLFR
ncbi:Ferrochelatase 2 isoform 3 [Theobroma cacao]|uniref:protoporphyrin ferrochelatase n=1 Tax=Theobroma cacao TaxID=3641 RepID=A0A061DNX9_THECC|nr:Ferrochelatase 2 isoform 3 [Theobroma cacao]